MVRFAIMVLMALRDLRFLSIVFFAHLTRPIASLPLSNCFFFYSDSVFKNRGVQTRHQDTPTWVAHDFVTVNVNGLFLAVSTLTVYEKPEVTPVNQPL